MKKALYFTLGAISLSVLSAHSAEAALTCICQNKQLIGGKINPNQTLSYVVREVGKIAPITEEDAEYIVKNLVTKKVNIMYALVECSVFCHRNSYQNYYVNVPRKDGGVFRFEGDSDKLHGTGDAERAVGLTYKTIENSTSKSSGASSSSSGSLSARR